jgi:predicted component of type VI protein secretion system
MKVNLIVTAAGPNNGKAIPIAGAKFLIGRDPHCNLRPASQAVSKQHCAILIRDGNVFVQDISSMNGTVVNGEPVQGEQMVKDGDALKIGPLEFRIQILPVQMPTDGTPLPDKLKSLTSTTIEKARTANQQQSNTGSGNATAPVQKSIVIAPPPKPQPQLQPQREKIGVATAEEDGDDAAAMLLGMDEDAPNAEQTVPGGSTIMEMPAIDAAGRPIPPKKKENTEAAESATAANDLLKKYFRRSGS